MHVTENIFFLIFKNLTQIKNKAWNIINSHNKVWKDNRQAGKFADR